MNIKIIKWINFIIGVGITGIGWVDSLVAHSLTEFECLVVLSIGWIIMTRLVDLRIVKE